MQFAGDTTEKDPTQTMTGGFASNIPKPSSGKERTLEGVRTCLFTGTEVVISYY